METIKALEYVMGIYGLSVAVTLLVWLVIVAIRWLSRERVSPSRASSKPQ
jgi:hypothetical protein